MFRAAARAPATVFNDTLGFGRESHYLHDPLQVIRAVVFNFDSALFFAVMQNDAGAQIFLQP